MPSDKERERERERKSTLRYGIEAAPRRIRTSTLTARRLWARIIGAACWPRADCPTSFSKQSYDTATGLATEALTYTMFSGCYAIASSVKIFDVLSKKPLEKGPQKSGNSLHSKCGARDAQGRLWTKSW